MCIQYLDPTSERDQEASIATHPTDPKTVLVTWREGEFGVLPRIFAALTTDGGQHWNTQHLTDPSLTDLPTGFRYAFDSTAAFGPDGTAYVLYGGEDSRIHDFLLGSGVGELHRMTLASSKDGGLHWHYYIVNDLARGPATVPDYMDLAVAPDTGRLLVVAQVPSSGTIYLWTSDDGGKIWSAPQPILAAAPTSFNPRITAGPNGVAVLAVNVLVGGDRGFPQLSSAAVIASKDGGKTWGQAKRMLTYVEEGTGIHDPVAIWEDENGTHIAAVYGQGTRVVAFRSDDGGVNWQGPTDIGEYPDGTSHIWLSASATDTGAVYAQARYGAADVFGITLLKWATDGQTDALPLVHSRDVDGRYASGDDYGTVSVAANGTLWTAWSDRRDATLQNRIAVTHVLAN